MCKSIVVQFSLGCPPKTTLMTSLQRSKEQNWEKEKRSEFKRPKSQHSFSRFLPRFFRLLSIFLQTEKERKRGIFGREIQTSRHVLFVINFGKTVLFCAYKFLFFFSRTRLRRSESGTATRTRTRLRIRTNREMSKKAKAKEGTKCKTER